MTERSHFKIFKAVSKRIMSKCNTWLMNAQTLVFLLYFANLLEHRIYTHNEEEHKTHTHENSQD